MVQHKLAGAPVSLVGTTVLLVSIGCGPGLAGRWHGQISLPTAPVRIVVRLDERGGRWAGTIDAAGHRGVGLRRVRFEPPRLRFAAKVERYAAQFAGTLAARRVVGTVSLGGERLPFWLARLTDRPPPANREEAWRQDLATVREQFLSQDRSFSPAARRRFRRALAVLEGSIPAATDPELIVGLARAVALAGNAHTRLYLLRNRTSLRRLPIRVYWFAEGLYVVRAKPAHRDTLGCRVVRIGGHRPEAVREKVAGLFAGNESWVRYKSVYYLTSLEILYGLRLAPSLEGIELAFRCPDGKAFVRRLAPLPLAQSNRATEAWWDLSPFSRVRARWVSALDPGKVRIPLYLQRPERHYWMRLLPGGLLYFQYNRAQNMRRGERLRRFARRLLKLAAQPRVRALVVDLRFNTGGSLGLARKLFRKLAASRKLNRPGHLFAIVGRATFSAGITHVVQLKQRTHALLVGEPVGDQLDTWSEGGNIVLPNSKLTLHFTTGFHSYSRVEHPENRPYYLDLSVDDVAPDVRVPFNARDYFSGRDPALDAVRARLGSGLRNPRP